MIKWKSMAVVGLLAALPLGVWAANDPGAVPGKSTDKPVYKPPLRGAPAGRVGGGSRGATERESFSLLVLAPDHVGYTSKDQPCLYWFISTPTTYPVELTVTERNAVKPLLEKTLSAPQKGGVQSVCLADFGVKLNKNTRYKWFVTLVLDPERRSKDIMAGGMMEVMETPASLAARLKAAENRAIPYLFAEEGFWYDAFAAFSSAVDAAPTDVALRDQRASLLQQVGLAEAAEFESRQIAH